VLSETPTATAFTRRRTLNASAIVDSWRTMNRVRLTYTTCRDVTPETQRVALSADYRFVLAAHQRRKGRDCRSWLNPATGRKKNLGVESRFFLLPLFTQPRRREVRRTSP
jgi:hypothetical protein